MDEAISSVMGAILFAAFTGGLAESINSIPFYVIVGIVIGLMATDTVETVRDKIRPKRVVPVEEPVAPKKAKTAKKPKSKK